MSTACGIFSELKSRYRRFAENIVSVNATFYDEEYKNFYSVLGCKELNYWCSDSSNSVFEFEFKRAKLMLSSVYIRRKNGDSYSKYVAVDYFSNNEWKNICKSPAISFTSANQSISFLCQSYSYHSKFRIRQVENALSYAYMQFSSLEVFGNLKETKPICTKMRKSTFCPFNYILIVTHL